MLNQTTIAAAVVAVAPGAAEVAVAATTAVFTGAVMAAVGAAVGLGDLQAAKKRESERRAVRIRKVIKGNW